MKNVYVINYYTKEIGAAEIKIRAYDVKAAKRIAKDITGSLIKDMRLDRMVGVSAKCAND